MISANVETTFDNPLTTRLQQVLYTSGIPYLLNSVERPLSPTSCKNYFYKNRSKYGSIHFLICPLSSVLLVQYGFRVNVLICVSLYLSFPAAETL